MARQAPFSGALQELAGKVNRIFGVGQTFSGNVGFVVGVGAIDGNGVPWEISQNVQTISTNPAASTDIITSPEVPAGTYDLLYTASSVIQTGVRRLQFRVNTDPIHRVGWENSVAGMNIVFPFSVALLVASTFTIRNEFLGNGDFAFRIFWKKRILDT